jgi:hypothetical protein
MATIQEIKKDLPGWPDEVTNEWLVYLSNRDDTGWPPPDPIAGAWANILGRRSLAWWADVSWSKETVDCGPENLAGKTRAIVASMRAEIKLGTANEVTQRRFNHALHYILNNGTFPNPVSGMMVDTRLLILDGNHRIAAHSAARILPDATLKAKGWKTAAAEQSVWIGTHKSG